MAQTILQNFISLFGFYCFILKLTGLINGISEEILALLIIYLIQMWQNTYWTGKSGAGLCEEFEIDIDFQLFFTWFFKPC